MSDTPRTSLAFRNGGIPELLSETKELERKLAAANQRIEKLESWKAQVLAVESKWDPNVIATMLGGELGQSQRKVIMEKVPKLLAKIQRLVEAGDAMDKVADAADDDIREHLQVANYNLHGLLNTGDRIEPPNPPQTIHQAGINASVAVRDEIRKARARWTAAKEEKL